MGELVDATGCTSHAESGEGTQRSLIHHQRGHMGKERAQLRENLKALRVQVAPINDRAARQPGDGREITDLKASAEQRKRPAQWRKGEKRQLIFRNQAGL